MKNGENFDISDDSKVKVLKFRNKVQIKNVKSTTEALSKVRKLNKNEYINIETGEVFKYNITDSKSKFAIAKQLKELKEIILSNFKPADNSYFYTLTFDRDIKLFEEAKKYLDYFLKRLRKYANQNNIKLLYVYRYELDSESGRVHIHMLLRDEDNKKIYIDSDYCREKLWRVGWVKVLPVLKNDDKLITIMELKALDRLSEVTDITNYDEKAVKKIEFGIANYICKTTQTPPESIKSFQRIYGKSRNVKKPEIIARTTYEEAKKITEGYDLIDEKTVLIKDAQSDKVINRIKTETYIENENRRNKNKKQRS